MPFIHTFAFKLQQQTCSFITIQILQMIENILKLFTSDGRKEKIEHELYIQYTKKDPESRKIEEKVEKFDYNTHPEYQEWKRLKYKSYDVKKVIANFSGSSFIDPDFPHLNSSISDEQSDVVFEWKRIPKFVKHCVYSSVETYHNFERISISSKKFKQALVFMYRTHPTKFKQLLAKDCNDDGIYQFKLYNKGIVQNVIIDDYVPVVKGSLPLMMGPIAETQIFPMLLEKAVAKVCGSYEKIPENVDELLEILFCGPLRKTKIDELSNTEAVSRTVQNTLYNYGVAGLISKSNPKIRNFGISENEIYHIINKFTVNLRKEPSIDLYELVSEKKLASWNGRFSHNDSQWDKVEPQQKAQLFKNLNKNKSFFISGNDVARIFDHLIVFDGTDIKNKQWIQRESEVLYPSFTTFELTKNDQVYLRATSNEPIRVSMILAKDNGNNNYKYIKGAFHESATFVQFTVDLRPGKYVICTHQDWVLSKTGPYSIFLSSDSHTLLKVGKDIEYVDFLTHLFKQLSAESKKITPTPDFLTLKSCYTIGMLTKETGFAFVDFSLKDVNKKQAFIEIDNKTLLKQGWEIIEPNANRKTIQLAKGEVNSETILILKTHKYVSQQNVNFPSVAFNVKI